VYSRLQKQRIGFGKTRNTNAYGNIMAKRRNEKKQRILHVMYKIVEEGI